MKKLLALVLALVMSMSLVTISNAAFKDADKIDYKEAVDVMNAVGVFVGDEKGNFNAKDNLTREQAAKIIAYLELGSKAADVLVGGATFTDVASSRWSAGFVGYCAQAGVVAGYDGKFDPAGQLTALQFGKMLLVEIGYDAKAAGMTGTDWAINTSKLMATTGLMKGIDGSVNQVLTREKAAQMTLNALKTPTVEYATKGSSVTVNGAEINFGASVPTYVTNTIAKEQTISKDKLTNSGEYTIELGEKLYKDLKLVKDTTDAFERPTHEWYLKTTKIGAYAEAADLEYTAAVKTGTIYTDLGLSKGIDDSKVTYFVDGMDLSTSWNWDIVKGDVDSAHKVGGNGAQTFVYYDDDAKSVKVVVVNTYVAKVAAFFDASSTKDAYVTLTGSSVLNTGAGAEFKTTGFAKDDIVLYTYSGKPGEGVQSMKLAEKVTGALGGYTTSDKATVGGTTYVKGAKAVDISVGFNSSYGKDVNAYLDQYGYVMYIDAKTAAQYAVVLGYEYSNTIDGARAKLLFTDGTVKTVDVALAKNAAGEKVIAAGATAGSGEQAYVAGFTHSTYPGPLVDGDQDLGKYDIVAYTVNGDDEYTLTLVADAGEANEGSSEITHGATKLNIRNPFNVSAGSGKIYANGKTVFLIVDTTGEKTTYSVYTGIANVPTIKWNGGGGNGIVAKFSKNGVDAAGNVIADVVLVVRDNANISIGNSNKDVTFIKGDNNIKQSYTKELGFYYEYDAVVNGEEAKIKTVSKVEYPTLVAGVAFNSKGIAIGWTNSAYWNGSSAVTTGSDVFAGKGTAATANDVVYLGGSYKAFDDTCKVYYFSTTGELYTSSPASIVDDSDNLVYYKVTDGMVTTIYIQIKDAAESVGGGATATLNAKLVKATDGKITLNVMNSTGAEVTYTGTLTVTNTQTGAVTTTELAGGPVANGKTLSDVAEQIVAASDNKTKYQATITIGSVSITTNSVIGG